MIVLSIYEDHNAYMYVMYSDKLKMIDIFSFFFLFFFHLQEKMVGRSGNQQPPRPGGAGFLKRKFGDRNELENKRRM